jgi:hypothetical protein
MSENNKVEIFDCEQGTDEWRLARLGIPTASSFATVLASGRGGAESKTRAKYMRQLAGEIITGKPMETYTNVHMERGKVMEAEARNFYSLVEGVEPQRVGFIKRGKAGCSPDSLIDTNGMLEIKTALPDIILEYMEAGPTWFPPQHVAQCQGQMWIAERGYVDLVVYWPGINYFRRRITRDEQYIEKLADAVNDFNNGVTDYVELHRKFKT